MKNYLYRLFRPVIKHLSECIEHLSEWKVVYISSILIVGAICGAVYLYEPAPEPDTYQICPKYSGNRCELLSKNEWERETVFGISGTNRFYNKKDPRQIKVFQFCDTREIRIKDYKK